MIDWNKSAKLNNCTVEYLMDRFKKFPHSAKRIITICEICNEEREISFYQYRDLCYSCAHSTPMFLARNAVMWQEYWSDQDHKDEQAERRIEYFKDPKNCEEMSRLVKQYFIDNPEAGKAHSEWMKEYCKDPKVLKAMSDRMKEYCTDPDVRKAMSETIKNSDACKAEHERQFGGHDIVKHHFIYDHNNPKNHTVEITRSQHTGHHNWMRRNGLEVPHVNVTEENKNVFR